MAHLWECKTQPLPIMLDLLGPVGETTAARYIRLKQLSDVTGKRFFRLCLDYEKQRAAHESHVAPLVKPYARGTQAWVRTLPTYRYR